MAHDWPTLHALYKEVIAQLGDTVYIRALVTTEGMILTPHEGETITLAAFGCQKGNAMVAHFAACILDHIGLGEFRPLRSFLSECDQLIAFRVGSEVVVGAQLRCK